MATFSIDDILNLEPSKVSRDLTGYITYVYGEGGVGKTTLAKDMGALILACEDGTRAMTGAYAKIMYSWSDIKTMARYLLDPRMKSKYRAVAIDTVDIAASLCEKYICSQNGVSQLKDIAYGGGWSSFKKEFEETFRTIALNGYAVLFISHSKEKTITRLNGTEYTKIVPTVSDTINNIVRNMSDIEGYGYQDSETDERYLILRSNGSVEAKSRFPYMEAKIPFGYKPLTEALNRAIDEEERVSGSDAILSERVTYGSARELDFDALMAEFDSYINKIIASAQSDEVFSVEWLPKITHITDKYLGKGKKVSQCNRDQVEQLELIVDELKELM